LHRGCEVQGEMASAAKPPCAFRIAGGGTSCRSVSLVKVSGFLSLRDFRIFHLSYEMSQPELSTLVHTFMFSLSRRLGSPRQ
jgi:hypothetical protein